ncbi:MAG: DUF1015 domain-containing protein [Candidatus Poribacteria bacterium]|nr:DUF1015 domain-containing protein [Candidatus Poribacteria bacterium]
MGLNVEILPFRGLRYNPQKISCIGQVIAPPYDVIKDEQRVTLERQHANNVVRLILSQPYEKDTDTHNQYTRTAENLRNWISERVLIQDASPNYYVYDQSFTTPDGQAFTRRALVGVGKLHPFGAGMVFPHEKTLAAPKADRLNLLRACHANLSPIFLLYSDPSGEIEKSIVHFTSSVRPLIDVQEVFGSTHQLWRLDDAAAIREIRSAFEDKSLVIADGHHRYETALAFRDELREQALEWTGEEDYNYMMMNLVRMESPGLVVLAIHRLLSGLSADRITQAIKQLPESFDVTIHANQRALLENLHALAGTCTAFGMYTGDGNYRLLVPRVSDETKPPVSKRLDVTLLHARLIKNGFGIDTTIPSHQTQVSYTVNTHEAIRYVKDGEGRVALLMNPTLVSQVNEAATDNKTMPQKSTYFYPKMATGLVFNLLNS